MEQVGKPKAKTKPKGKKDKPHDMLCICWQWGGSPCRRYHRD